MDKKVLIIAALSFFVFVIWQSFFMAPKTRNQRSVNIAKVNTDTIKVSSAKDQKELRTVLSNNKKIELTKEEMIINYPNNPSTITIKSESKAALSWVLNGYKTTKEKENIDLEKITHIPEQVFLDFDDTEFLYLTRASGTLSRISGKNGILWSYEDEKVLYKKTFENLDGQPFVTMEINLEFKNKAPKYAFVSLRSQSIAEGREAADMQISYWSKGTHEAIEINDDLEFKQIISEVMWITANDRYFLVTIIPDGTFIPTGQIHNLGNKTAQLSLVYPLSGKNIKIPLKTFVGPKAIDILKKVEPSLDRAVDFGWFTVIAYPILEFLRWLYNYVRNYGVAIIILTLLLKIVTYPLTYKSMKSMKKMSALQPQIKKMREKYKDDKEKLNKEMMIMMRGKGYNPLAGCWPILIQMPVFIALYRVLYGSVELYQAPFAFWLQDLSVKDPYYITPVLLGGAMFLQQKLQPNTATDPTQAKIMQFMPIMFAAFMLYLPSGLTLYMLTNFLAGIIQQLILNKKLNVTLGN